MRVFLDANVLFSAATSDGSIRRLLRDLANAGHVLVIDSYVREEALRNLLVHFPACRARFDTEVMKLELCRAPLAPAAVLEGINLPDKDEPVLNAALVCRCDFLVTGDRTHFGILYGRTFDRLTVLSPRMLAERLL